MPYASANGIRLYYEQSGTGPDLLLIAGLGAHSGAWIPQRAAFARAHRVTLFDNRGAGRSDAPDEPYSIRQMADDTAALADALGIGRAHVVGASMGGMIAQELAINYPALVSRLVLACTRARAGDVRRAMGPVDTWLRHAGLDRPALSLLMMPWVRTREFMQDEARVLRAVELSRADPFPISRHAYMRQHAAVMAHDTLSRLDRIQAPTLVLVGADDVLTPPWESEVIAARIPDSILRVLPAGGHVFNDEFAADFNAAVLDFLGPERA